MEKKAHRLLILRSAPSFPSGGKAQAPKEKHCSPSDGSPAHGRQSGWPPEQGQTKETEVHLSSLHPIRVKLVILRPQQPRAKWNGAFPGQVGAGKVRKKKIAPPTSLPVQTLKWEPVELCPDLCSHLPPPPSQLPQGSQQQFFQTDMIPSSKLKSLT